MNLTNTGPGQGPTLQGQAGHGTAVARTGAAPGLKLGTIAIALAAALAGCGDDPVPLEVEMEWTVYCEGAGCAERDEILSGRPGAAIPGIADDRAELGIECEIVEAGDTRIATSIKIQDRNTEVQPTRGINIRNGRINVGSSMTCPGDGFELFDENQFTGTCGNLADGACTILVSEYSKSKGRLVFDFDCQNLPFSGDITRSVRQGLVTLQGCNVTEDTR